GVGGGGGMGGGGAGGSGGAMGGGSGGGMGGGSAGGSGGGNTNGTCAMPIEILAGGAMSASFTADTASASDSAQGTCITQAGGNERVYHFTLADQMDVMIVSAPEAGDDAA